MVSIEPDVEDQVEVLREHANSHQASETVELDFSFNFGVITNTTNKIS